MEDVRNPKNEPTAHSAPGSMDLDGDGKISPWESNLCRICLISAIILAFGDNALQFIN